MQGFPSARPGQVVGLLGGSFDPAHAGHVHITKAAMTRFGLDHVWWLVSPGNPLKHSGPKPIQQRLDRARAVVDDPRVTVSDIEAHLQTTYTADTIAALINRYPTTRFVWLMGADNLAQFHRWQNWQWIAETVPMGILARPGDRISGRVSKTAKVYREAMIAPRASRLLGRATAPAWCFVNLPMSDASSTKIRSKGDWR